MYSDELHFFSLFYVLSSCRITVRTRRTRRCRSLNAAAFSRRETSVRFRISGFYLSYKNHSSLFPVFSRREIADAFSGGSVESVVYIHTFSLNLSNAKATAKQVASLRATATRCASVSEHLRYQRFFQIRPVLTHSAQRR